METGFDISWLEANAFWYILTAHTFTSMYVQSQRCYYNNIIKNKRENPYRDRSSGILDAVVVVAVVAVVGLVVAVVEVVAAVVAVAVVGGKVPGVGEWVYQVQWWQLRCPQGWHSGQHLPHLLKKHT